VLTTAVAFVVVLSVLILVHELGHFFAAKSVGIAAPRFSLGLGPRVWGFRWGETDFVISAIPLGGYVKMAGMEGDEAGGALEGGAAAAGEPPVDPSRTFDAKPLWARAWVISAGVIMNLLFAVVTYTVLGLVYGELQIATTQVQPDTAKLTGVGAQAARIPAGAKVVAVGATPVKTYDEIIRALRDAPAGPITLRFAAAPEVALDLPAGKAEREALVDAIDPAPEAVIGMVVDGRPAARAGLRPDDRVVAIGGAPVRTWEQAVRAIESAPGKPLPFVVERGGKQVALTITPEASPGEGGTVGKIGAQPRLETVYGPISVGEAVKGGFQQTWGVAKTIVNFLGRLFSGKESARQVGGILAIGEMSGQAARQGMDFFLGFLAAFSVNLAVLNLLPIPILDGGHLLFLAIEAVRGRPLSVEARIRLSHVGLIIVVAMMLWANGNDILRKLGI
jgi:regulator of sigma E protease